MLRRPGPAVVLLLQESPPGPGAPDLQDQGDRRDAGALRLSQNTCAAAAGGLAGECQAREPALSRDEPAVAEQVAEAESEGEAPGGPGSAGWAQRRLGHGLRA